MTADHGIHPQEETIAAVATALGEASIGVVRVSGSDAAGVVGRVFRTPSGKLLDPPCRRGVWFGVVVDPDADMVVDEGILLWMPGPHSYTAEDVAELQVHGGVRVVRSVLECVLRAGARLAEPGEFTKRAFLNGRLDLSQSEAVMDLIRSKTERAQRAALAQVQGGLGHKVRQLRRELIGLQAHVEVTIDYPEHDVERVACAAVVETGSRIRGEIAQLVASACAGQVLREGVATVIVGRPNVGKSSLLNALLRRERAIVTELPGTTRDVLEEYVNLGGIPYRLVDTAGIRETDDLIESIGVARSRQQLSAAELAVVVLSGADELADTDLELLDASARVDRRVVVVNKCDLPRRLDLDRLREVVSAGGGEVVEVSALRGFGLRALEAALETAALGDAVELVDSPFLPNTRQAELLRQALADLDLATAAARENATLDVIAVSLQAAYASLGLVIGEEAGEDLLDEIFSRFCLGK